MENTVYYICTRFQYFKIDILQFKSKGKSTPICSFPVTPLKIPIVKITTLNTKQSILPLNYLHTVKWVLTGAKSAGRSAEQSPMEEDPPQFYPN